ncbi:Protein gts1 [Rhodotorula toruloides]
MSKTATDRYQRQLLLLLKEPGNDECADCKARSPRWASWDQGVFLCVQCASMHRKIGSHVTKVKSVTLDKWTKEQVENMRQLGNVKVNSMLNPDERRHPPPPQGSGDERNSQLERFIRNKYEYRAFAAPRSSTNGLAKGPTAPPPAAVPGPSLNSSSTAADPVPPLPRRPTQPTSSAFDDFSSAFGPPAVSTSSAQPFSPGPALPPRPPLSHVAASAPGPIAAAPAPRAKSVRFPEAPPTFIPSPPDSDDEGDGDGNTSPPRPSLRPRARSASALPPRKGILRFRPGGNDEILVDWAALTSPPPGADGEDEEDVPLASLGALGMRGAQVGMAAVPAPQGGGYVPYPGMGQQQGMWAVPYGGQGQGAQGGNPPPVAPLQPQYTGSAKGYLHQQRQQQAQALQPQQTGTGIDAFQQLLQPPAPSQPQQQQQPAFQQHQQHLPQPQQQYSQPQLAQPQARTNPFHAHLFARNAYSPSPQPPSSAPSPQSFQQQHAPQQQPQQPQPQQGQTAKTMNDIWADLDLLGGSSFSSAPQPSASYLQAPFFGNAPTPSPSLQTNPPAPAPLRPQLTGFVPSSSFGQQLARESSPFPSSASLTVPNATAGSSRSASPASFEAPKPLQPQRTGFVPSSAFGQELARDFGGGSGAPSPALNAPAPAPLQPQRTGFVPSSQFGLELAKESGGTSNGSFLGANGATGEGRSVSPAPFDFAPSPARTPQPPTTYPFSTFSSSLSAALPPLQLPPPQQQQQQLRPNPFLQPQLTGFNPTQQPMRPQQTGYFPAPRQQHMPPQMQMGLQPQLTGFQGGGARPARGGGKPLLAFGQANGGQAGWQR